MNRSEAVKALARAGKGSEVQEVIDKWNQVAAQRYAEIRNDRSRTEDYKRWLLAVACSQVGKSLDDELVKMGSRAVAADRDDAERVFGVRGVSGDAASLVISRRDAGDRASAVSNGADLRDLLARATRSGDEVLARAVAERAMEMQNTDTLHQFVRDRPQLDGAVERLWNAERAGRDVFAINVGLTGLKPEELGSTSFDSIEAMAHSGEPAAS